MKGALMVEVAAYGIEAVRCAAAEAVQCAAAAAAAAVVLLLEIALVGRNEPAGE